MLLKPSSHIGVLSKSPMCDCHLVTGEERTPRDDIGTPLSHMGLFGDEIGTIWVLLVDQDASGILNMVKIQSAT